MTKLEGLQAEKEQIVVRILLTLLHYTTPYCITCIALHFTALIKEKRTTPHHTMSTPHQPQNVSTFVHLIII